MKHPEMYIKKFPHLLLSVEILVSTVKAYAHRMCSYEHIVFTAQRSKCKWLKNETSRNVYQKISTLSFECGNFSEHSKSICSQNVLIDCAHMSTWSSLFHVQNANDWKMKHPEMYIQKFPHSLLSVEILVSIIKVYAQRTCWLRMRIWK